MALLLVTVPLEIEGAPSRSDVSRVWGVPARDVSTLIVATQSRQGGRRREEGAWRPGCPCRRQVGRVPSIRRLSRWLPSNRRRSPRAPAFELGSSVYLVLRCEGARAFARRPGNGCSDGEVVARIAARRGGAARPSAVLARPRLVTGAAPVASDSLRLRARPHAHPVARATTSGSNAAGTQARARPWFRAHQKRYPCSYFLPSMTERFRRRHLSSRRHRGRVTMSRERAGAPGVNTPSCRSCRYADGGRAHRSPRRAGVARTSSGRAG